MSGVASEGKEVEGDCNGDYESWEVVGSSEFGPIWGFVTRNENGTVSTTLKRGSSNVYINGKSASRKSDTMDLNKDYPNVRHHDPLSATGRISTGSSTVFVNGLAIARKGDTVTANGCSSVKIKQGSENVISN
ncbi:PAAR domain-containing protein [Clostridium tagluense]|uniref:PAAR motif protein n=1 Tax=Clostridium tagluense TaxID=360422 RepID=A0A401UQJ3_9CLOT|nr:PAAR domain-containing protein [Clostridium tagluense]GCD11790.1 hypothetical protein Ctaglu_34130 [Clostridium tagluense]